jgi:porphobilinogen synthase
VILIDDDTVEEPTAAAASPHSTPSMLVRPRRLRSSPQMRALVRETRLHPTMLVAPLFVRPGTGVREPISSLPPHVRYSVDELVVEAERLAKLGIGGLLLFGLPEAKDATGTGAWSDEGIVQQALRALRDRDLPLVLMADTCLCEYTDHGHCGVVTPTGRIDNDASLELLAESAVAQARAGAGIVAPSAMMDGQVAAIRSALDACGFADTAVMAYAAKAASAFYGPFREAAGSAPAFGDRRSYQKDPANARESIRELELDVAEGADLLLVKPAITQLDQIAAARARFDLPIAAYQVSGEYAMLRAAAERGWIDGRAATLEAVTSIARAGAGIVITYAAADIAQWLHEDAR